VATRQIAAADFTLSANAVLFAIEWDGGYLLGDPSQQTDQFTIQLYVDDGSGQGL